MSPPTYTVSSIDSLSSTNSGTTAYTITRSLYRYYYQ